MADGDETGLRLNELQRFRKTSSRLALEAHGSCEVPAGCGGVVLRWRRPEGPIGLSFSLYVAHAPDDICLDGRRLEEQRAEVPPGEHVLSFTTKAPRGVGFVLMSVKLHPKISTARRPTASSSAGGHWRASLAAPGAEGDEGWRLVEFDDGGFVPLVERPVPKPRGDTAFAWKWLQDEATGLGLPEAEETKEARAGWLARRRAGRDVRAWVRWKFRVNHEGFA